MGGDYSITVTQTTENGGDWCACCGQRRSGAVSRRSASSAVSSTSEQRRARRELRFRDFRVVRPQSATARSRSNQRLLPGEGRTRHRPHQTVASSTTNQLTPQTGGTQSRTMASFSFNRDNPGYGGHRAFGSEWLHPTAPSHITPLLPNYNPPPVTQERNFSADAIARGTEILSKRENK